MSNTFVAPVGFDLASVSAGIRTRSSTADVVLLRSRNPCSAAGVFTKSAFPAAPVLLSRSRLQTNGNEGFHSVVINAGCANAVTGDQGIADAQDMATLAARAVDSPSDSSLVMSTGVIGHRLPIDKIRTGIAHAKEQLQPSSYSTWLTMAQAIMTTDTFPKLVSRQISLPSGRKCSMAGVAKGAGMIHPDMATMLSLVCTDARVRPNVLQQCLSNATNNSWNCVSVDGDTSTNDTALVLANGSGSEWMTTDYAIGDNIEDTEAFENALTDLSIELAKLIARDGEGATKFISIRVIVSS